MVVIRLARKGAKKNPFYHIVAADSRYSRDGRYIEQLGYFNPTARGNETRLQINQERIDHWVKQGAQPSERIHNLLKEQDKGARPAAIPVAEYKKAQAEASAKATAKKAPAADTAKTEEPTADTAKAAEEPAADTAKTEEPTAKTAEAPAADTAKAAEAPAADTAKTAEAPAAETAKTEEPTADTATEEPAADDAK